VHRHPVRPRHRLFTLVAAVLLAPAVLVLSAPPASAQDTSRVSLRVQGMVCPNCERTVESVLSGTEGVLSAEADRRTESVTVTYDPARTTPEQLAAAVNTQTYYQASLAANPSEPPKVRESSSWSPYLPYLIGLGVLVFGVAVWQALRRARTIERSDARESSSNGDLW
jgi:copper chaperone CopZ